MKKEGWGIKKEFNLKVYNTAITREDFEASFRLTKEKVTFTFNGWDGKSYHGESRTARVYRSTIPGYEDCRFIKVGKAVHLIDEKREAVEEATGISHKTVGWIVDVLRRA